MSKIKFRTLLSLLFDSSIIIHAGNRYISHHSKSKEFLPLYNYSFFSYKTGRVFYTVKGSGSPLLLIHDALEGGSGYEWSRVEDSLAQDHTVYMIDLPGCGRSDKYGITYTNFLFVHMISQFIHNVIRDKTSVIACGYSSSIVMMANIYDGSLFKDIILINPSDPETVSKKVSLTGKIYRKIIEIPVYGTMIYNMHSSHEAISSRFMDQYFHNPFHVERDVLDAFYEGAHKGGYYCKSLYASLASGFLMEFSNRVK